jgi:MFS family permease
VVCDAGALTIGETATAAGASRLLTWRFGVVMLAAFAYFTMLGGLMPAVPRYVEDELSGNGLRVGLAVGAMTVTAALLRPTVGSLGDKHGRRLLIVAGGIIVAASVALYAVATSLPLLIVARLLTGVGEAAGFVGLMTAAQDLAPDDRRGEATSYFSVSLYGGLAAGPPLAEWLLDAHGFVPTFLILAGSGFAAAALGCLVPTGDTLDELPPRAFMHRAAIWPGTLLLLGLVPLAAFASFLTRYADDLGVDNVGPIFAAYAVMVLVIRIVGARIPDLVGWRRCSMVALSGVAIALLIPGLWHAMPALWIGAVFLAAGMSLLYPALLNAVFEVTPASERTHAVGSFSLFFDISQGLGATVVGAVITMSGDRTQVGFLVAGLFAVAGLGALFRLRDRIGAPAPAS